MTPLNNNPGHSARRLEDGILQELRGAASRLRPDQSVDLRPRQQSVAEGREGRRSRGREIRTHFPL